MTKRMSNRSFSSPDRDIGGQFEKEKDDAERQSHQGPQGQMAKKSFSNPTNNIPETKKNTEFVDAVNTQRKEEGTQRKEEDKYLSLLGQLNNVNTVIAELYGKVADIDAKTDLAANEVNAARNWYQRTERWHPFLGRTGANGSRLYIGQGYVRAGDGHISTQAWPHPEPFTLTENMVSWMPGGAAAYDSIGYNPYPLNTTGFKVIWSFPKPAENGYAAQTNYIDATAANLWDINGPTGEAPLLDDTYVFLMRSQVNSANGHFHPNPALALCPILILTTKTIFEGPDFIHAGDVVLGEGVTINQKWVDWRQRRFSDITISVHRYTSRSQYWTYCDTSTIQPTWKTVIVDTPTGPETISVLWSDPDGINNKLVRKFAAFVRGFSFFRVGLNSDPFIGGPA